MRLERVGTAGLRITLQPYELASLAAAARWVAEGAVGELPAEALAQLRTVLATYEAELAGLEGTQYTTS
ncbi:MAG TPA: hypothetical protein VE152_01180 [Acidimicrobiales bacterium]|jgi:hypothetical protein|nr:hypothetical protein [Acidimicrobiales bacterium]